MIVAEIPPPLHGVPRDVSAYKIVQEAKRLLARDGFSFGDLVYDSDRHYIYPAQHGQKHAFFFFDWYYGSAWYATTAEGQGEKFLPSALSWNDEKRTYEATDGEKPVEQRYADGVKQLFGQLPVAPPPAAMPHLQSKLALRIYEQVVLGIDKPLGYTLAEHDEKFNFKPVAIPAHNDWYVRHHSTKFADDYVPTLVAELAALGVRSLSLASCRNITDAALLHLRDLDLSILDLFNTNITDAGLEAVTSFPGLRSLNLAGTKISDGGVRLLQKLPKLESLHLGWTALTDAALEHIKEISSLKLLVLRNTKISDEGMKLLAQMRGLQTLQVEETEIHDSGVENLLPLSDSLVRLYLGYTRITDESLATLRRFSRLRTLMLRATAVKRDHDAETKRAMPLLGGVGTGPQCIQEGLIR